MKILFLFLLIAIGLNAKDYSENSAAKQMIQRLVDENGFDKEVLVGLFGDVKMQKSALRVFLPRAKSKTANLKKHQGKKQNEKPKPKKSRPKKRYSGSWDRYSRLKINKSRVNQGVAFVRKYKKTFDAVEKKYGVPSEYIAAIIGVETVYGNEVGNYPVFDTLSTLSFEPNRRNGFFKRELREFIRLSKSENFNPKSIKGSYAAAIGLCQFIPSNYKAYGVDFNNDGYIRLQEAPDAIASVANYFKKNRWQSGEPVAKRVHYKGNRFVQNHSNYKTGYRKKYNQKDIAGLFDSEGWDYRGKVSLIKLERKKYDELWYGTKNFFVITRYNHSSYYAMSVHQLAEKIKERLHED